MAAGGTRYGAKIKWAEVDIETGELPASGTLITSPPGWSPSVGVLDAGHGGRPTSGAVTKLVHDVGGLVIVDHTAAALPPARHRGVRRRRRRAQRRRLGRAADRRAGVPCNPR